MTQDYYANSTTDAAQKAPEAPTSMPLEASALPGYVMSFLPEEMSSGPLVSPLDVLLNHFAPLGTNADKPEALGSDEFSL